MKASLTTYNLNLCSNATAASTLSTLTNCSASIGEGCTVPPLDTATLASCQASLQAVADKSQECYNLLTETNAVSCRSFGSFGFLLIYSNSGCISSLHLLCCCSRPGRGDKAAEVQRQGILQHCQGLKEQLP